MPSLPSNSESEVWFDKEVRPHEPALRGYLQKLAPASDVDDLMQETHVRILRAGRRGDIQSIRSFLFAVARNATSDLFRRRAASKTIAMTEMESRRVLDEGPDPLEMASRRQEIDLLHAAIQSLPARCRTILVLRKFEHLSQAEIASRLGIAVHTVEAQLTKGLHRCEEYFRKNGAIPN